MPDATPRDQIATAIGALIDAGHTLDQISEVLAQIRAQGAIDGGRHLELAEAFAIRDEAWHQRQAKRREALALPASVALPDSDGAICAERFRISPGGETYLCARRRGHPGNHLSAYGVELENQYERNQRLQADRLPGELDLYVP